MTGITRDSSEAEPWDEQPEDADAVAMPSTKNAVVASSSGASINSKTSENDMVRTDLYVDKTEPLEDGDLPALSLSRSVSGGGGGGGGNEKRGFAVVPLNAHKPSEAELSKQREFWSQLDDSPSLHTNPSDARLKSGEQDGNPEDGPNDEMSADRAEAREDTTRMPKTGGRNGDHMEQIRMAESEDSADSKDSKEFVVVDEQEETNFCDQTLGAMESICGQDFCGGTAAPGNQTIQNPHVERRGSRRQLQLHPRGVNESVEEHTAIEVEYVEPDESNAISQDRPENWSPSRKNAYLAAMARKAKEDFERSQAKEFASMSEKRKPNENATDESAGDVYNTFTASEKRKFLRLINSGLSSTESAERVRSERKANNKSKDEKKKESKKGKLFKFWKKGSSSKNNNGKESKAYMTPPLSPGRRSMNNSDDASLEVLTPDEEKKEEDIVIRGDSIDSQAVQASEDHDMFDHDMFEGQASRDSTEESLFTSPSGEDRSEVAEQAPIDDPEHRTSNIASRSLSSHSNSSQTKSQASQSQVERFRQSLQQQAAQDTQSVVKTKSIEAAALHSAPQSPSRTQKKSSVISSSDASLQSSVASPGRSLDNYSVTSKNALVSPEDNGFDGRFAKSGINYYDAVRRDISESEEESDGPTSPSSKRSSKTSKLGPSIQSPKLKGFSKLAKSAKEGVSTPTRAASQAEAEEDYPSTRAASQAAVVVTPEAEKPPRNEVGINDLFAQDAVPQDFAGSESVASASTSVRGRENEAFEKMEKELLRPVRKTNTVARVVSPEPAPVEKKNSRKDDFNMQEYLNSTEVYSASGTGNDAMSVVSGKSFSTAETSLHGPGSVYTQSSTFTQSSRKRRPGAAKNRLAKAKEAEKHAVTKQGWHESIRAAAQSTNRVWKPKVGWVDYEEADDTANLSADDTTTSEKLHLNLSLKKRSQPNDEDSYVTRQGPAEPEANVESEAGNLRNAWGEKQPPEVPSQESRSFGAMKRPQRNGENPSVFKQDPAVHEPNANAGAGNLRTRDLSGQKPDYISQPSRQESDTTLVHTNQKSQQNGIPLSLDDMSVEESVAHSVDHFVRTVGAAPAPRRRESPSRTKRMATSPSKRIGWIDSMKAATANVGKDGQSWDPMNGWANEAEANNYESPSAEIAHGTVEERQTEHGEDPADTGYDSSVPSNREPSSEEPSETHNKINLKLPSRESRVKKDSAVLDKWARKETKFSNTNKMAPLQDFAGSDDEVGLPQNDSDDVPLLNNSDEFSSERIDMKATVNVIRQKVGEDDLNWFPKQQPRRVSANASANASTHASTLSNEQSKEAASSSIQKSTASRRSVGPVDVDEVENLDFDSDDDEKGVVWDGVVFESDAIAQGSPSSPDRHQNVSGASKSGSSVTSKSSFSKTVPKLSQNIRDTSPIRGRKTPETSRSAWRDNGSTSVSHASDPETSHRLKHEDMQAANGSASHRDSSKQSFMHKEAQPAPGSTTHKDSSMQSFEARSDHDDSTAPSSSSSIVKLRAQQWESRAPKDTQDEPRAQGETARLNSATAEWKSFLGKKVRAENEAATREKERMQLGNDRGERRVLYADEQSDSLFDFSHDGSFPVSPSAVSSPPRKNMKDSSTQAAIAPPEGSDFSDGNEINKGFFTRLAGCAAPMMPKRGPNGEMPNLAFLRTGESGSSRFMPQYLCGRPDVIHEEAGEGEGDEPTVTTHETKTSAKSEPSKPRYKDIHAAGSEVRGDTRSVISEDFGAKTAYLEALAMKTAVSKPRRSSSRTRGDRSSTGVSEASVSTAKSHKEKWNDFLERKAAAGASPVKSRANGSDASAAAESYAAKKVDEMMAMMASRSKSTPRSWRSPDEKSRPEDRYRDSRTKAYDYHSRKYGSSSQAPKKAPQQKTDSIAAAEALAAARVNAMMEALANSSNNNHTRAEEGEI